MSQIEDLQAENRRLRDELQAARMEAQAARQALAATHGEWTFPRQDSTRDQLRSVLALATDARCYDAADEIRRLIGRGEE